MIKQVIVMRKDLNMRKGKMISQGSHASLKVILDMMEKDCDELDSRLINRSLYLDISDDRDDEINKWLEGSVAPFCVSCYSEEELIQLFNKAIAASLPCSIIQDAGLTEFNGVPTNTCIAIGPADSAKIDDITGHLKLL